MIDSILLVLVVVSLAQVYRLTKRVKTLEDPVQQRRLSEKLIRDAGMKPFSKRGATSRALACYLWPKMLQWSR